MQFSPKLKKAAEEINRVLLRHNLAGFAVLHTPGFIECITKLDPTYSCCRVNGDKLILKVRLEDYNGNIAAWKKSTEDTGNMLRSISLEVSHRLLPLIQLSELFDEQADAQHSDSGGKSSHTTQNN